MAHSETGAAVALQPSAAWLPSQVGVAACCPATTVGARPSALQQASPEACPSPTTACKDKLHKSFQLAKIQVCAPLLHLQLAGATSELGKVVCGGGCLHSCTHKHIATLHLQVNRDLEAFIEDARKAAVACSPTGSEDGDVSSMDRILMIAERCLDENVATFRDSIQTIVDQVEVSVGEAKTTLRPPGSCCASADCPGVLPRRPVAPCDYDSRQLCMAATACCSR